MKTNYTIQDLSYILINEQIKRCNKIRDEYINVMGHNNFFKEFCILGVRSQRQIGSTHLASRLINPSRDLYVGINYQTSNSFCELLIKSGKIKFKHQLKYCNLSSINPNECHFENIRGMTFDKVIVDVSTLDHRYSNKINALIEYFSKGIGKLANYIIFV